MSDLRETTIGEIVRSLWSPHRISLLHIEVIRDGDELSLGIEKDGHRRVFTMAGSTPLPTCVAQCAELFALKGSS